MSKKNKKEKREKRQWLNEKERKAVHKLSMTFEMTYAEANSITDALYDSIKEQKKQFVEMDYEKMTPVVDNICDLLVFQQIRIKRAQKMWDIFTDKQKALSDKFEKAAFKAQPYEEKGD